MYISQYFNIYNIIFIILVYSKTQLFFIEHKLKMWVLRKYIIGESAIGSDIQTNYCDNSYLSHRIIDSFPKKIR